MRKNEDVGAINAFVTTQWSVVLAAQGSSPAAEQALEKLCRTYWRPIFSFVRRERRTVEDAQDLADETLNRVARRLADGGAIETEIPAKYCYTTARFVFPESLRARARAPVSQ